MAISEQEPIQDNDYLNELGAPKSVLGSAKPVDLSIGGALYGPEKQRGLSIDEIINLPDVAPKGFGKSFGSISAAEIYANRRYPIYDRNMPDLEDVYAESQPWYKILGNGIAKMGLIGAGTFAQSLTNFPNVLDAARSKDLSELSGDPDGYEGSIDNWVKNINEDLPNYASKYVRENPFLSAIPFMKGNAYWWGEKFIPNLGFMLGAVGGAVVQDIAIGAVTEGIGEIPLLANQIGKASLYLNKLFSAETAIGRGLGATQISQLGRLEQLGERLGKTEAQMFKVTELAQLAAAAKLGKGFRTTTAILGSAMTEAGVESRNGYSMVKDELTNQYKLTHAGEEPTGDDLQQIENLSTNAMNTRFGINMALLTVSNSLQFNNLFKTMVGVPGSRAISGSLTQELEGLGKVGLKEGSLDVFEKKAATSVLGKVWESVRPTGANIFREGVFEEGGQFAAERGTYDYYTRKYKSDKYKEQWNGVNELINSTVYGLNEQFTSTEGLENMLIGGLTGLVVGGVQSGIDAKRGLSKDARLATATNVLNQVGITSTLQNNYDNTVTSAGIAKDMEEAAASGDVFKYKNLQADEFFNFVTSRLPSGMHDVTVEQLNMLKNLSKEQFESMFQLDFNSTNRATVSEYVDGMIAKSNDIKDTYETINNTFKNPFKINYNADDINSIVEANNYITFEKYKKDLTYFAAMPTLADSRIQSIQESVNKINPNITIDVLSQLTNNQGLAELAKFYEEKATSLKKTITDYTTPVDKKKINDQIKALRTRSELIAQALNTGKVDDKTFDSLLNFELNGQDATLGKSVASLHAQELMDYSVDINALEKRKKDASKAYDEMSTKEGFEKYFKEAEEMASDKDAVVNEEEKKEETAPTPETPKEPVKFRFNNANKQAENLEVDREYEMGKVYKTKINKLDDDRWQVVSPDGTYEILPSKEKAQERSDELTDEFNNLQKIKVLALNPDGSIKIEDVNGDIYNIDPRKLSGFSRVQTDQEKLQKIANQLGAAQTRIEIKSGAVSTDDPSKEQQVKEPKKKRVDVFFISTVDSMDDGVAPSKTYQIRTRQFLNNVKNFSNRDNIKVMLVTPKQYAGLGLTTLDNVAYGQETFTPEEQAKLTDVDNGLVTAVYVEQDGSTLYYVDKEGKRLSKVDGTQADVNSLVFANMPTASLYYNYKDAKGNPVPRFRQGEEAEATAYMEAWKQARASVFASDPNNPQLYSFSISRGMAVETPVDGKPATNHVGDNLIPEKKIKNQANVIVVSTTGTISHNGENYNIPKGRPMLQYGDTLQWLNNRKFTQDEAKSIFEALRLMSEDIQKKAKDGKAVEFNPLYSNFLQNILFWKKGAETKNNQMYIDDRTMDLYLGGKKYNFANLAISEKEIVSQLQNTFNTVNNDSVKKNDEEFTELYFEDGYLKDRQWPNYQSYLLSSKLPNGKGRSIKDTPLSTSVTKPSDQVPYNYRQKYVTLGGLELAVQKVTKPIAPVAKGGATEIGGYKMDGTTTHTRELKALGNVTFTARLNSNGVPAVTVDTIENLESIVADPAKTAPYFDFLKKENLFDATRSEQELMYDFASIAIANQLNKMKNAEPAPKPTAPVVSDIETKKAAIKGSLAAQGTSIELEIIGDTGKEFLLTVDRKGNISLFSEKQPDGSYKSGEAATKEAVINLYKKYVPSSTILKIQKWLASFTGSWAAPETEDGKNYDKAEKALNSELAALESDKPTPTVQENVEKLEQLEDTVDDAEEKALEDEINKQIAEKVNALGKTKAPKKRYREIAGLDVPRMTDAELQLFKEWHAKNAAGIPFEVLQRVMTTNDGRQWGAFENGVAKFYKSAARGTEYHEIFHGIFDGFLSAEERQLIFDEFKSKSGKFKDRATGNMIYYEEATDQQAEERIADDFADFRLGKLPAKSIGERILKFFRSIIQFVREFVNKPSKKDELFKAIDAGKFKDTKLNPAVYNQLTQWSVIPGLDEPTTHESVQDVAARFFFEVFSKNMDVYNPRLLTSPEIFDTIKGEFADEGKLDVLGEEGWNQLVKKTREFLRSFKIEFDENNIIAFNNDDNNNRDYAPEPFSVDWKKQSSFPIKITVGSLVLTVPTNQENALRLQMPDEVISANAKGFMLLNFSRAFATILNKISNTSSIGKVVDKLLTLAKQDSNYVRLWSKLGGTIDKLDAENKETAMDYSKFKAHDWRLFINFYQTFTKQHPNARIQYVSDDEVYTGSAELSDAIDDVVEGWIEGIKALSKDSKSLIVLDKPNKVYKVGDLSNIEIKTPEQMVEFLGKIGVIFPIDVYNKLTTREKNVFGRSVGGLLTSLRSKSDILSSVTSKLLDIKGPLNAMAEMLVRVTNPNFDPTHINVEGERTNGYAENNNSSVFENEWREAGTLKNLKQARPELNDPFSTNSLILKEDGLYIDEDGNIKRDLKVGYIQGTKDVDTDDGTSTSKLTLGNRYTQEINENVNGRFYILLPAESSTEWQMDLGINVPFKQFGTKIGWDTTYKIFQGYLKDDIALAKDADVRKKLKNIGNRAYDLRFFKDILSEDMLAKINTELVMKSASDEEVIAFIAENEEEINGSIKSYFDEYINDTIATLKEYGQVVPSANGKALAYPMLNSVFAKISGINRYNLTDEKLRNLIEYVNINYVISNIEFHKILFGDPYQFALKDGESEETKRIKSFLSPRRTTFDMPEYNEFLDNEVNKAGEIELTPDDLGYHEHKSHTNTVTIKEIYVEGGLMGRTKEADAQSWIMDTTNREVKLKNAQWTDEAEIFHQWQMAYTRNRMAAKGKYTYTNDTLKKQDAALIETPVPKYGVEVLKPIVTGNKLGKTYFELVLDKFSQLPLYYQAIEGTTLEGLYIKMWEEKIGYAILESGRKMGTTEAFDLYKDGKLNPEPFNNLVQVPWKAYGIQVETNYDVVKAQTRGSQPTKLVTVDLFDNGVPVSQKAKEATDRNNNILDLMHENAYNVLLERLGIEDLGTEFILANKQAVSNTLVYEMLRRELDENAKDTVQLDSKGEFPIPFEASPSYKQIKDILYSVVQKTMVSPKVNGGPKVQVSVTGWENLEKGRRLAIKTEDGYKEISREDYDKLSDDEKKKVVLTDDTLKFYTKDDPYMEIMLPHWFGDTLRKTTKYKTDEEIINYLNITEEGKSILRGVGFRVPAQELSSLVTFRVKKFLPQFMGESVVVPSEITTLAGSDFDIDKLNTYLKSIYIDVNGNIRLVKWLGSEEATKDFFRGVYKDTIQRDIDKIEEFEEFRSKLVDVLSKLERIEGAASPESLESALTPSELDFFYDHLSVFKAITDQAAQKDLTAVDYMNKQIEDLSINKEKLTKEILSNSIREDYVKDMYKRSLENEYYDSMEELLTLPENFERLISPVNDAGLEKLSVRIGKLVNPKGDQVKNKILNRNFMTKLRHYFVTAKRWIGIAATNITSHSLFQKGQIYLNPERFFMLPQQDRKFIGDGSIILPHNKVKIGDKEYVSLSGTKTADGKKQYISSRLSGYGTAFVDVANKPYIVELVTSDLSVGTFMFLERIGAGEYTGIFMSQPIIREYLKQLDSQNKKGLFSKLSIEAIKSRFITTSKAIETARIDINNLEANIADYYAGSELGTERNAEQHKILDEFLKYAKLAEYNFDLTQAINYDTTRYRSGDTLFKKQVRTDITITRSPFSGIAELLDPENPKIFIAKQRHLLDLTMEGMGVILKLEQDQFRINVIDPLLKPYARNKYVGADDFERIANKLKASFLDYIIQTKTGFNSEINKLFVNPKTSVSAQLEEAKKISSNPILNDFKVISSPRPDGVMSVKLTVNIKGSAYDKNLYIGYMRQLRDTPSTNALYKDLVKMALLQGTYENGVSIASIIPIEDSSKYVAPIMAPLMYDESLDAFADGGFQRNNWKDNKVFKKFEPKFWLADEAPVDVQVNDFGDIIGDIYQYQSSDYFPNIDKFGLSTDRRILALSEEYDSFYLSNDYLLVPRVVQIKGGERVDMKTGLSITNYSYIERKNQGDMSLKNVYGYKKVYYDDGTPVTYQTTTYKGEVINKHVYKLINLRGDGRLVSEHYTDTRKSVLNNGTEKIENEISDDEIRIYFNELGEQNFVSSQSTEPYIQIPEYVTDEKLKNADGTKRFAQASKLGTITINPPKSVDEFFNYFEGKEGGPTSEQKAKVLNKLADKGYTIDVLKTILNSVDKITNFLVLHEKNHVENNDIDVYWKNGKDLLTDDKVDIETRATIAALDKLGGIPSVIDIEFEDVNTEDTEGSDNPTPCGTKQ
jgi:hypothetical protein